MVNTKIQSNDLLKDDALVNFEGISINVEIADTPEERAKGLSGKQKIGSEEGMLFVSAKASISSFWMKEMNFPLDFIWINGEEIVDITENVPNPEPGTAVISLPTYKPNNSVDKVLEVNAGFVQKHGIKIGDIVDIQYTNHVE